MKKANYLYPLLIISILALGFMVVLDRLKPDGIYVENSPTTLETINERGSIKCSYLVYSPYFKRDPNTGELSGIFYDIMEEIGKRSDLKIDWVEEVGYDSIYTGLDANRYDVFAGGLWPSSSRARSGGFTISVFYSLIKAWGRPDDKQFLELKNLNDPSTRIAVIDGAMEDIIAETDYPRATKVSLPELAPFSQNLLNITSGKADLTFAEPSTVLEYLESNPGSLVELAPEHPLRIFGNALVVRSEDNSFRHFLNNCLMELLYSGYVDKVLTKYEPATGVFPRVAIPYDISTSLVNQKLD